MWKSGITQYEQSSAPRAYPPAIALADAARLRWRSGTDFGPLVVPLAQEQRDSVRVDIGQRAASPRDAVERRSAPLADGVDGDTGRTGRARGLVVAALADQHQRRAHARQLRLDLTLSQLRVDRQRDRRGARDGEERDDGRRRVPHDHGDGIARPYAQAVELLGERLGDLAQFGV